MFETILSPVELGTLKLKNRIIFAPTSMGLQGEEYYQKIEQIASGGCAMIIIGDCSGTPPGLDRAFTAKRDLPTYQKLTEICTQARLPDLCTAPPDRHQHKGHDQIHPRCSQQKDHAAAAASAAQRAGVPLHHQHARKKTKRSPTAFARCCAAQNAG